jgi:Na+-transporting methylmalonyl-CoA/oxaloacetate decarboxylase gamma subunit
MIIVPMPTQHSGSENYTSSIMSCVTSIIIDVAISGLFIGVAYFAYIIFKEQEYVPGFLLVIVNLLVLALAINCFGETVYTFKDFKIEHKEKKSKKPIETKKQASSDNYGDFVTPYYSARNKYHDSKSSSVNNYVMSLFKKEKQNERK